MFTDCIEFSSRSISDKNYNDIQCYMVKQCAMVNAVPTMQVREFSPMKESRSTCVSLLTLNGR